MHSTSPSLLERLRKQDNQHEWSRFVDLYSPLLLYWAHRMGLERQDAEDFVQDIFLHLLHKMPDFVYDRKKSFRSWLHTVTINKWRERFRRKAPQHANLPELEEPDGVKAFWEEEYRQHLANRAVELIQNEFQATTWKAFWEFVTHDRPAAEVAEELKISVNAVYIAKSRVLTRLREELEGLMD